jgi:hypothetical protein
MQPFWAHATGYPVPCTWLDDGQAVENAAGPGSAVVPKSEADGGIWKLVASS